MRHSLKRLVRLATALAVLSAVLVPTAIAGAGDQGSPPDGNGPGGSAVLDHECDGDAYDASSADHILYGRTEGTPVDPTTNKMVLDLRDRPAPQGNRYIVFWDGHFTEATLPAIGVSDGVYIEGSHYNDTICGTSGNDIIYGRMGNDRIFGNGSTGVCPEGTNPGVPGDRLFGNRGHDFITPGAGTGLGNTGSQHNVVAGGGRGNDTIYAGNGDCTLTRGGQGNDFLYGGYNFEAWGQVLRGGAGNDWIWAGNGNQTDAYGSAGDDVLIGAEGFQATLHGNTGNDVLYGGTNGYQRLFGGAGDDTLVAGGFAPVALFGGQGNDLLRTCYFTEASTTVVQPQSGSPGYPLCDPRTESGYAGFGGPGDDVIIGSGDLFVGGTYAPGGAVDTDDWTGALTGGNATRTTFADCLWGDMPYDLFEFELCMSLVDGQTSGQNTDHWNDAELNFRMAFPVDPTASGNDVIVGGGSYSMRTSPLGGTDFLFGGPGDDLLYSFGINGYLPEQYAALAGSPESADMDSGGYNGRTSAGPVAGAGDIAFWPIVVSFGNDGNDTHFSHCISGSVAHPDGNAADGGAGTAPRHDTSHQYWGDNSGSYLARIENVNDQCGADNGFGYFGLPPFVSGEGPTP